MCRPAGLRGRSLGAPCFSMTSRNSYQFATVIQDSHPDVELALVFLVDALRELCALGSHPPCVVGFRSASTCLPFVSIPVRTLIHRHLP